MNRLNDYAEIVTEHFTKCFVDLRGHGFTSESLTKLRLDHVERSLDIGSLVVVSQEFFAVVVVEPKHPSPER